MKEVYVAVQSHGGWAWPMFGGDEIQRATCAADLRRACKQENGPIAYMFAKGALASKASHLVPALGGWFCVLNR